MTSGVAPASAAPRWSGRSIVYAQGAVDGSAAARLLEEVQVLPGHQLGAHHVVDGLAASDRVVREASGQQDLVRPRQAQVAEQDGRPDAEALRRPEPLGAAVHAGEATVRGGQAAARVGAVHHVVVDEGAGLEEFQRGGCTEGRIVVGSVARGTAKAPVAEGGPQPLPAGKEGGECIDHRREIVADHRQDLTLLGENLVDDDLHAGTKVGNVEGAGVVGHPTSLRATAPEGLLRRIDPHTPVTRGP
jgi:hypothetical protein